jgi:glycosyltransferase involved in cell wall biosynthesis
VGGTGGPTRGYRTVSENLRAALTEAGVEWTEDAATWLHVCPPHLYTGEPGRVNALLTMFESDQVPPDLVWRVSQADVLLVPCEHNRTVLKWAGYRKPIRVVPLAMADAHAVDVPLRPDGPFRFLWVGQPSSRKGPHLVNDAFREAFAGRESVELVMKTVPNAGAHAGFETGVGRVRVIARAYTDAEMAALYRSAHAFVFPSYGEGWGLPVLEAMAAGCLVLAPVHTGIADFFDPTVGWALPWHRVAARYGVPVSAYEVDAPALVDGLRRARDAWPLTAGVRARARRRALTFTWTQTARRVLDALAPLADRLLVSA